MANDILENKSTNPNPQIGNNLGKEESGGKQSFLSKIGDILSTGADWTVNAAVTGKEAIKGLGKYGYDTFTADRNSVPIGVRLAVAGARNAEDKLRTLRQFYPDAMPTMDNDFTFIDPETKKRVTLNDAGLSIGDVFENVPEISEGVGATIGAIGGGYGGTYVMPGPGTVAGGIAGAGIGGAAGNEIGRQFAQKLGSFITGKESIDNRTGTDMLEDAGHTATLNSAFGLIPYGGRFVRNKITERLLTPESAATYKQLAEKGYDPTLGQIGSDAGKELSDRQVAGGLIKREQGNQKILEQNTDQFLGDEVAGLDENALANQFRESQQANISGKKAKGTKLYKEIQFGDEIPSAENSKALIEDLYQRRGGSTNNPDLMLDASMERKMQRIAEGEATEREINSFRSDVKTALRNKDLKHDTREVLQNLDETLTNDLIQGSPKLSEADRAARQAWFEYKDAQKKVGDIIGRSEGVTDGTAIGQGLTEGQALNNAKKVFSSGATGSDSEAQALANVLTPQEKRSILASILKEDQTAKGFQNSIEKAQQKYNMERVGKYLINPEEKASFDDLIKQAQGTKAIPEGFRDRSDLLNAEAAMTGVATLADPSMGAAAAGVGNILRGAPGTAGGSGQFGTSMVRQNIFAKQGRKLQENMALKAAKQGEIPGQLNYMPQNPATIPLTMGAGQAIAGNTADLPESNMRIPQNVINENLPEDSPARDYLPQVNIDEIMSGKSAPVESKTPDYLPKVSLDDLIKNPENTPPTKSPPVREMQPSVALPQTNEQGQKLPVREMDVAPKYLNADDYIAKKYGSLDQNTPQYKDADDYIAQKYGGNKSANNDGSWENPVYKKYREGRSKGDVLGIVKDTIVGAESGGNYRARSPNSSATGKYQFIDATREKFFPGSTREEFMNNPDMQEKAMDMLLESNRNDLARMGIDVDNIPPEDLAGAMWAAHLRGSRAGFNALNDRNYIGDPDANGTTPRSYFDRGRRAYLMAVNSDYA